MALLKAVASRVDTESARIMSRSLPSDKKVWRKEYGKHFVDHVKLMSASREVCLSMACEGLRQVYSTLRFARAGEEVSLDSAMMHPTRGRFRAARIRGRKAREPFRIPIPAYSVGARALRGGDARGADCVRAVRAWAAAGVVEPSCIRAIEQASVGQWDAEIASHVFVVMGAGAASLAQLLGPLRICVESSTTHHFHKSLQTTRRRWDRSRNSSPWERLSSRLISIGKISRGGW